MDAFYDLLNDMDFLDRGVDSFLYAPEYLVYFVVATALAIALPLLFRKLKFKERTVKNILIGIWAFALVYDVSKWCFGWIETAVYNLEFSVGAHLPLHTCSTFWYTAPITLFAKNDKVRTAFCNFVCTVGLFGGAIGMYMGTAMMNNYSLFSYYGSQMMLYHTSVMAFPLMMLLTGYYKPKKKDFLLGFAVFGVIALPTFIFDCIFAVDYMYIYDCSTLDVFYGISQAMPHRIFWTLIAVIAYFLLTVIFSFGAIGIRTLFYKCTGREEGSERECFKEPSAAEPRISANDVTQNAQLLGV